MQAYLKCKVLKDEGEINGRHVIKVLINKSNTFKEMAIPISVFDDELLYASEEIAETRNRRINDE